MKCYFCSVNNTMCYSCSKAKEAFEIGIRHGTNNQTLMFPFSFKYLQTAYEAGYKIGVKHDFQGCRNKRECNIS